jgi:hypothetical protein
MDVVACPSLSKTQLECADVPAVAIVFDRCAAIEIAGTKLRDDAPLLGQTNEQ